MIPLPRLLSLVTFAATSASCGSKSALLEGGGSDGSGGTTETTSPTTGSSATPAPLGCVPGATQACYSGPEGTLGVGQCTAGEQVCLPSGEAFGPCEGEIVPAAEDCSTEADEDCDGGGGATCGGSPYWSRSLEGGKGRSVASDAAGNVVVASTCEGSDLAGAPAGPGKLCLAKLDPQGTLLWSKVFGGSLGAMQLDAAGNIWIAGSFTGTVDFGGGLLMNPKMGDDGFVAKLDPDGDHLHSAHIAQEESPGFYLSQRAYGLAVMPDGGVALAGSFQGSVDFGGGPLPSAGEDEDAFVVRLDQSGNHVYSRAMSGGSSQHAREVLALPDGSVVVAGGFGKEIDCGGGLLGSAGIEDVFVAKLDPSGAHVWSHRMGGTGSESVKALAPRPAGGFFLAAAFQGSTEFGAASFTSDLVGDSDALLGRLAEDGSPLDAVSFEAAQSHVIFGLAASPAGDLLLTGTFSGDSLSLGDTTLIGGGMFLARVSSTGALAWARRYGEADFAGGVDVALDPKGDVLVIGALMQQSSAAAIIDFGDADSPHSTSDKAMFIAKVPP